MLISKQQLISSLSNNLHSCFFSFQYNFYVHNLQLGHCFSGEWLCNYTELSMHSQLLIAILEWNSFHSLNNS